MQSTLLFDQPRLASSRRMSINPFLPHAKLMLSQRYHSRATTSLRKRSDAEPTQWSALAALTGLLRGCQPANDARRSDITLGRIEALRLFLGGSYLKVAD